MVKASVSIYTVGHKPFWLPRKKYLIKMAVSCKMLGAACDSIGDNIAPKNPYYNEMTALYWIWKNDLESQIIGLQHYRRIFIRRKWGRFELLPPLIRPNQIRKKLEKYDVIVPKRHYFGIDCQTRISTPSSAIRGSDIPLIRDIIRRLSPNYLEAWDNVMHSNNPFLLNMFIMRRELMAKYCEWVFPVLFELEKVTRPETREGNERRLLGLASEYLFDAWVIHEGLRVYEAEYIFCEDLRKKMHLSYWVEAVCHRLHRKNR